MHSSPRGLSPGRQCLERGLSLGLYLRMSRHIVSLPPHRSPTTLGFVDGREDKRALRLVCKRSRASVDSRVVAVEDGREY